MAVYAHCCEDTNSRLLAIFFLMTECMDDKALPEGWPESCQSLDQSLQIFVKIWEERTVSRQNQLNCA